MPGAGWGGCSIAGKLSADQLSLIFNGGSVLLLPTHYLVQHSRHSSSYSEAAEAVAEAPAAAAATTMLHDIQRPLALLGHACFGFGTGVVSALMGVGGLPVVMSYLTLASPLPHHLIQGTAMCAVVSAVAAHSQWSKRALDG